MGEHGFTPFNFRRNKLLLITEIAYFLVLFLFAAEKSFVPYNINHASNSPNIDNVFVLGFAVCLSTMFFINSYYAWTLDENGFSWWRAAQDWGWVKTSWWMNLYFEWKTSNLWGARFLYPFFSLAGLIIIGFNLYNIIAHLLR